MFIEGLKTTLLKDYGWCKVALLENEYFLCFDEGQVVIKMNSYKISEDEANQAIKSEEDAEKITRTIQIRNQ